MGLRMSYKDKSTEDFNEQPQQGFPNSPQDFEPYGITKAMAVAAGWPGPGLGAAMPPTGTNIPGQGAVPGVWSPGAGYGAFNPNAPVYATGQGNPMGYGAGAGWSGPGNPHGGGWGGGLWGGVGMAEGGSGNASGYSGGNNNGEDGRNR